MSFLRFDIVFLEAADHFLGEVNVQARRKIILNIEKSRHSIDPKFFKKIDADLWEFRTEYNRIQYRLIAFWDKRSTQLTLVVATHGFIKKSDKIAGKEFERAYRIRKQYFENDRE